jgi:hypothetical protein
VFSFFFGVFGGDTISPRVVKVRRIVGFGVFNTEFLYIDRKCVYPPSHIAVSVLLIFQPS